MPQRTLSPKEYDRSSWQRKFEGCWALVQEKKTKELSTVYILEGSNFNDKDGSVQIDYINPANGRGARAIVNCIYHIPYTGWHKTGNAELPYCYLSRKLGRSYYSGINDENTRCYTPTWQGKRLADYSLALDFVKEPVFDVQAAVEDRGPISKMLFLSKTHLRFRDQIVGTRRGKKLSVVDWIKQEAQDALRSTDMVVS